MKATPKTRSADAADAPIDRLTIRLFFGNGVAMFLAGALLYGLAPLALSNLRRALLVAACLAGAAMFAASARSIRRFGLASTSRWMGGVTITLVIALSVLLGEGLHAALFGFFAVVICVAGLTASVRSSLIMTLICAAAVLAMAVAQDAGLIEGAAAAARAPLWVRLVTELLLLASSVAAAALIARASAQHLQTLARREEHFHALLRIAADGSWELDAQFRLTRITGYRHATEQPPNDADDNGYLDDDNEPMGRNLIGHRPWEIGSLLLDAESIDRWRADLEAHLPLHDLLIPRQDRHGRLRYVRASGQPRFDGRGVFVGYWGVMRDVTTEITALRASGASELRYRELFTRAPSPLLLHRNGRVIDANPAAVALFGYRRLDDFRDVDIAEHYVGTDAIAAVRERIAQMEAARVGESLPPVELPLVSADGRRLLLLATSVRVEVHGGPATLAIYYDDTERREAHAALRRSETTLSHLVATSRDVITLTELATGRYITVNASFTRVLGWRADEAIGRSSSDLGVWVRPEQRQRMIETIRLEGGVEGMPVSFRAKSGAAVQLLVSAACFELNGRQLLVINAHDISAGERTRLELQAILDHASIGIAFMREHRIVQANAHFERMFGWPPGAMIGQLGSVVWASEAEYDEAGRIAQSRPDMTQPVELEHRLRRRDGSAFWCRLIAQAIDPSVPNEGGTIWIAEDITERRRVEQALSAARDAAEDANRAKTAFLANTSHEIRTPLNALVGMAALAQQPGLDESLRTQYLRQIEESASTLSDIISDILDFSKIEAGKLTIERVPFDLHALLQALERAYSALAAARGLKLALHIGAAVPATVLGDPLRLRQILVNYLSNALKFTERGEIRIVVRADWPPLVQFSVHDTGGGIDDATLARLFQPFTQADDSMTRRHGGTGLGLSICRELAGLMGGRVGADSRQGEGSRFWVELPLVAVNTLASRDADASPPADLAGGRVLLVEDNPVNMLIAAATLERWGIDVTHAADGRAAIDAVDRAAAAGWMFDAVLMDVQMPLMSGHETTRVLRRRYRAEELPIIALTAAALASERSASFEAGMTDFLTKPIDGDKLRQALLRARAQRRNA